MHTHTNDYHLLCLRSVTPTSTTRSSSSAPPPPEAWCTLAAAPSAVAWGGAVTAACRGCPFHSAWSDTCCWSPRAPSTDWDLESLLEQMVTPGVWWRWWRRSLIEVTRRWMGHLYLHHLLVAILLLFVFRVSFLCFFVVVFSNGLALQRSCRKQVRRTLGLHWGASVRRTNTPAGPHGL